MQRTADFGLAAIVKCSAVYSVFMSSFDDLFLCNAKLTSVLYFQDEAFTYTMH